MQKFSLLPIIVQMKNWFIKKYVVKIHLDPSEVFRQILIVNV